MHRSLAGERRLLYCCFRACLEGQFTQKDRLVFFLYLQLKLQFRSEMIQVNGQVGFANFADYEVRKGELLGRNCYWVEATRMGLNGPLSMGSVTSLEARIGPKATPRELKRRIQEQDWYKEFADQENARARSRIRQEFGSFDSYLWQWTGGKTLVERGPTTSPLSDAISKDLKKRGMKFVGSTIIYAYLQAVGVLYAHEPGCFLEAAP